MRMQNDRMPTERERRGPDYWAGFGRGWLAKLYGRDIDLSPDERNAVVAALNRHIDAAVVAQLDLMAEPPTRGHPNARSE
jgi:hypothetical protein